MVAKASPSKSDVVPTPMNVTKSIRFPVQDPKEPAKEFVPSKSGVLKKLKQIDHRPPHSLDRLPIDESILEQSLSSLKEMFASKIKKIRKTQINRKGVLV